MRRHLHRIALFATGALLCVPAAATSTAPAAFAEDDSRHPDQLLTTQSTQQVLCALSKSETADAATVRSLRRGTASLVVDRQEVTSAWIDIERSDLDPAQLHIKLEKEGADGAPATTVIDGTAGSGSGDASAAVHATTWGVTIVTPLTVGDYQLRVSTPQTHLEQSTVALTTLDQNGVWVDAQQRMMPLALDEPGPDDGACEDPDHGGGQNAGGGEKATDGSNSDSDAAHDSAADTVNAGALARTGIAIGWTLGIVAALLIAGLALLWANRRCTIEASAASHPTNTDQENDR